MAFSESEIVPLNFKFDPTSIVLRRRSKEFLVEFVFDSGSAHFVLGGLDAIRPNEKTPREKEEINLSKFNSTYF